MLPYIPPPKPVSAWDLAALGAVAIAGTACLSLAIWAFFAAMPVAERALAFVVAHV